MATKPKHKFSERQQRSRRASKLRDKKKNGRALTDDEREWLAAYEATKVAEVAARAEDVASDAPPPSDDAAAEPPSDDVADDAPPAEVAPPVAEVAPPPLPKAPPLPRPPRIEDEKAKHEKRGKGGDWRAKYEDKDGDGREVTCKVIADQWHGFLRVMADQIKASGVDPIVNPDDLFGSMMLTVDEFMPENVKLSPRTRALAGTTAILAHRFVRRKEIAEALGTQQARKDHDKWQADRTRAKEKAEAASTVESTTTSVDASPVPSSPPTGSETTAATQGPADGASATRVDSPPLDPYADLNARIARDAARANGATDDGDERPLY